MLEVVVMVLGTLAALGWVGFAVAAQRAARAEAGARQARAGRRALVEVIAPPPAPRTDTMVSPR